MVFQRFVIVPSWFWLHEKLLLNLEARKTQEPRKNLKKSWTIQKTFVHKLSAISLFRHGLFTIYFSICYQNWLIWLLGGSSWAAFSGRCMWAGLCSSSSSSWSPCWCICLIVQVVIMVKWRWVLVTAGNAVMFSCPKATCLGKSALCEECLYVPLWKLKRIFVNTWFYLQRFFDNSLLFLMSLIYPSSPFKAQTLTTQVKHHHIWKDILKKNIYPG